jgi:hypothetical protein
MVTVDKVVISTESLARFIDDIAPGAYTSMTKIDFEALDQLDLQPVGIYGSKSEIISFLHSKGAIDETT